MTATAIVRLDLCAGGGVTRPQPGPALKPKDRPVGLNRVLLLNRKLIAQAEAVDSPRRVVAKVEFHFGELFPRAGFSFTNLETDSRAVVRFYNKRGTAEQWIKEGKQAV
jgi:hypothetical protein